MTQFKTIARRAVWIWLLIALFGVTSNLHAQVQELDFSKLDDAQPLQTLSQTEKYKEAIGNTWFSVSNVKTGVSWNAPYSNQEFSINISIPTIKKLTENFKSYLVSPALSLKDIAGKQLNLEWKTGTVKGDTKLSVILINKKGELIDKIGDVVPTSSNSAYEHYSAEIPESVKDKGVGFVAFYMEGNKDSYALFKLKNIKTGEKSEPIGITAEPAELDFGSVGINQVSEEKFTTITVANFNGEKIIPVLDGQDKDDFIVRTETGDALSATGGKLFVKFQPKAVGNKTATITITIGNKVATVTLKGKGTDEAKPDKPEKELLENQFFWDFDSNNMPKNWEVKGEQIFKREKRDSYHSDTGFGVGIKTGNDKGFLKQVIDLQKNDVTLGDEIECQIHYTTISSAKKEGPLRLALRWLNDNNEVVKCGEDAFINNPKVFFGKMKSWGTLTFRTICPENATKLEFAVEVQENSEVSLDDFSANRMPASEAKAKPLIAILPQVRTIYGEVGETETYDIAIQTMHLSQAQKPNFSGGDRYSVASNMMKLDIEEIGKNETVSAQLIVTPTKKGAFKDADSFTLSLTGAEETRNGNLLLIAYFVEKGKKPSVKLSEKTPITEMKAEPGKTVTQNLEFDVKDIITDVKLAIEHTSEVNCFKSNTNIFMYNKSKGTLYGEPKLRIDFRPLAVGTYEATLVVSTILGDTVRYKLKGICEEATAGAKVEKFTTNTIEDRFAKEPEWKNFGKYDLGYWKIEGKWNGAGDITLNKGGMLYFDDVLINGLNKVKITPATAATSFRAEYSIDGGGHWLPMNNEGKASATGEFTLDNHRPTLVRFVNTTEADVDVNTVLFYHNESEQRTAFNNIAKAMMANADATPLTLLNERFDGMRHRQILSIQGWQNLIMRGDRPFWVWKQRENNLVDGKIQHEGAYITFWKTGVVDHNPYESWLVSPTLSYKQAASKFLTFSLRFNGLSKDEQHEEFFQAYIITEKDGVIKEQVLDIEKYKPTGVEIENETWLNYRIDLSKVKDINIDDNFHLAFSFYSKEGGNYSALNWMIDNVSFGRTDLPEITVDKEFLYVPYKIKQKTDPVVFKVTTKNNPTDKVSITLSPSKMKKNFQLLTPELNPEGGDASFIFFSEDSKKYAAAFIVQVPGAETVIVKALADLYTGINSAETPNKTETPYIVDKNICLSNKYQSYKIYSTIGQLLQQGGYEPNISIANLQHSIIILRLFDGNETKTYKLHNK